MASTQAINQSGRINYIKFNMYLKWKKTNQFVDKKKKSVYY